MMALPLYLFERRRFVLQKDLVEHLKVPRECTKPRHDVARVIRQARLSEAQAFILRDSDLQRFNAKIGLTGKRPLSVVTVSGLKRILETPGVALPEPPQLVTTAPPKKEIPPEEVLRHSVVMALSVLGDGFHTVEAIHRKLSTIGESKDSTLTEVYDELSTDWFLSKPDRTVKSRYIYRFAPSNKARRWLRTKLRRAHA